MATIKFPQQNQPSPRDRAQDIAWQAMECMGGDREQAAQLCYEALDIYPDCVDALHMLADIESKWQRDFIEGIKKAIEAGRRDLGQEFFEENKGHFWGLIETRPFMRAMAALAETLVDCGEYHIEKATAVHEEMLELNPNDNQGIRYGLLGCYLAAKRYYDTQQLIEANDEQSTFFLWGQVLLDFATEGKDKAMAILKKARQANPYVEQHFFPRKQQPKRSPQTYSPGNEDEAIVCARLLHLAWKAHSPARRWLKDTCE